jgi:hypothetical protein
MPIYIDISNNGTFGAVIHFYGLGNYLTQCLLGGDYLGRGFGND